MRASPEELQERAKAGRLLKTRQRRQRPRPLLPASTEDWHDPLYTRTAAAPPQSLHQQATLEPAPTAAPRAPGRLPNPGGRGHQWCAAEGMARPPVEVAWEDLESGRDISAAIEEVRGRARGPGDWGGLCTGQRGAGRAWRGRPRLLPAASRDAMRSLAAAPASSRIKCARARVLPPLLPPLIGSMCESLPTSRSGRQAHGAAAAPLAPQPNALDRCATRRRPMRAPRSRPHHRPTHLHNPQNHRTPTGLWPRRPRHHHGLRRARLPRRAAAPAAARGRARGAAPGRKGAPRGRGFKLQRGLEPRQGGARRREAGQPQGQLLRQPVQV